MPNDVGSTMCCCMKQPNPDRFVVMLGIPITVHSAAARDRQTDRQTDKQTHNQTRVTNMHFASSTTHWEMELGTSDTYTTGMASGL